MNLSNPLYRRLKKIGGRAASTFETIINTYELALKCKDMKGDFVEGGYLIIDDYGLTGCRKACDQYGLTNLIPVKGGQGVVYMKKCIHKETSKNTY